MRYIATLLLLILSSKGFSQQIGKLYNELSKEISSDTTLFDIQTKTENDFYYIQASSKTESILTRCWYFGYEDGKCYSVRIFYTNSVLNSLINNLNKDFVSKGELTWKDYNTNCNIFIIKKDEFFVLQFGGNN